MTTKPNLVLLPGLMCDHTAWAPLLSAIGPHACIQIIDHGQANSLVTMAQQVLALAPAQFALAGHSMGGRVALEVLRLAPERVTHLSLMSTGFMPLASGAAGQAEVDKRMALVGLAQQQSVRAMAQAWVQPMVAPERLSDVAFVASIVDMIDRKSVAVFEHQIKALIDRPNGSDVLKQVKVPTLVLCSEFDGWATPEQHQAMAALIPAVPPVVVVPGAGHMVTMESPAAVAQAMLAWLSKP